MGGNTSNTSQVAGTDIQFHGGNNITLSGNGSTISFNGYGTTVSRSYAGPGLTTPAGAQNNTQASIQNLLVNVPLAASAIGIPISIAVGTAANTSSAGKVISLSVVFYTRNGSTLSSFNSGSASYTGFYQSNSSSSYASIHDMNIPLATTTIFVPNRYYFALHMSTATYSSGAVASWTNLGQTVSVGVMPAATAWMAIMGWNVASNATGQQDDFLGLFGSGGTAATIQNNAITGASTQGGAANVWFDLRNYTV
jgi:hypothetical protein